MGVEKRVSKQPKITILTHITQNNSYINNQFNLPLVSCKHLHKTLVEMYHF